MQVALERGRVLYEPGDPIEHVYFPQDGVVSLMALMESGVAIETSTIGPEGALGLSAASGAKVSMVRAQVQIPVHAARIGAERLHEAWLRSPALRDLANRHAEALYGHTVQSAACNALHSVEARFCRWLLNCRDRMSSDTLPLTQEFLADALGVQRTTVTAVAQSLQARGAIRYRRGLLEIQNRGVLEHLACECYEAVRDNYRRLLGT